MNRKELAPNPNESFSLGGALLDSSLIKGVQKQIYNIKIEKCGDMYINLYKYNTEKKLIKVNKLDKPSKDLIIMIDKNNNYNINKKHSDNKNKIYKVELKNIIRSKIGLQKIIKSNENIFKTFITLTYADNITDINIGIKDFSEWVKNIKKVYRDFKYVAVPEFQKRGAIHFHLICNLEINKEYLYYRNESSKSKTLIYNQKGTKNMYDVAYWNKGFTSIFSLDKITNVTGYMTKYFTKDINNRLFSHRKYYYSRNLKKPVTLYFETSRKIEDFCLNLELLNYSENYSNIYFDKYNNEINFIEYKRNEISI